jgi:RHS repeat-associated protein
VAAWHYDTVKKGLLASATSYSGGDVYTNSITKYSDFGTVDTRKVTLTGTDAAVVPTAGYTTFFKYAANGVLTDQWDPLAGGLPQEDLSYGFAKNDPTDEYTSLSSPAWNYVSATGYSEYGEPQLYTLPTAGGAIWLGMQYDKQTHNLTDLQVTDSTTSGTVDDLSYTFGSATVSKGSGLITKIVDKQGTSTVDTQCYSYDYAARLSQAWTATDNCAAAPSSATVGAPAAPYWQSWTYDPDGSRHTETDHNLSAPANDSTITYNYPATGQPHTLTNTTATGANSTANTGSYTYNASGDTTAITRGSTGNQTLTWTATGKLDTDTTTTGTTQYVYDAGGNLVVRRDPSASTLYLGDTQLVLNRGSGTTSATRFYSINGTAIASRTSDNRLTYLVSDRQGTAQLSLDATTQAVTRRQYQPFGQVRGAAPATWSGDLGYDGGTTDSTTSLVNLGAREYDPVTGRFLSVDPVLDPGDTQQFQGYDYANNDPVTLSDVSGTDPCSVGGQGCSTKGNNGKYYPTEEDAAQAHQQQKTVHHPHGVTQTTSKDGSVEINGLAIDPDDVKGNIDAYASMVDDQMGALALVKGFADLDDTTKLLRAMYMACDQEGTVCTASFRSQVLAATAARAKWESGCRGKCFQKYEQTVRMLEAGIGATLIFGAASGAAGSNFEAATAAELELADVSEGAELATLDEDAGICGNSFDPDTPVLLADGTSKPIGDIKVGDVVKAADPITNTVLDEPVTQLHRNNDEHFADLTIRIGGHEAVLRTTVNHLFWDDTAHAWTPAAAIKPGDRLATTGKAVASVASIRTYDSRRTMDNLTIARLHTYYVLAAGVPVLVHNSNCGNLWGGKQDGWQHVLDEHVNGSPGVVPGNTTFSDHLDLDDIGDLIEDTAQVRGYLTTGSTLLLAGLAMARYIQRTSVTRLDRMAKIL